MERPTDIFDHTAHLASVAKRDALGGWIPGNQTCSTCHTLAAARSAASAKPCLDCHKQDMTPTREIEGPLTMSAAKGYRAAMHETCIKCHEREAIEQERPALGECGNCHETLRRLEVAGSPRVATRPSHRPVRPGGA
jgi:hypothetical protein